MRSGTCPKCAGKRIATSSFSLYLGGGISGPTIDLFACGDCRYLAQVLQRRRNHGTFKVVPVAEEERPDLLERFKVHAVPTLVVVQGKSVAGRLERPRGCREIEGFLAPWLQ